MITVINHGIGNFGSISNALNKLGINHSVTVSHKEIINSDGIIIPGVGSFRDGMDALKKHNLIDTLNECALIEKKPILGICLGFQMMANLSEEFGLHQGLSWINGIVRKFNIHSDNSSLRIPHVGWNDFNVSRKSQLMEGIPNNALFYYTHSYHLDSAEESGVLGYCNYGYDFVAGIEKNNIYGVQFHPEKSQNWGLQVLSNFARIANKC